MTELFFMFVIALSVSTIAIVKVLDYRMKVKTLKEIEHKKTWDALKKPAAKKPNVKVII